MPASPSNSKEPKARYWNIWYIIVIAVLVTEIFAFMWLTDRFRLGEVHVVEKLIS